jgi:hypothetical protein
VNLRAYFWVDVLDKGHDILTIRTRVLDSCRRACSIIVTS